MVSGFIRMNVECIFVKYDMWMRTVYLKILEIASCFPPSRGGVEKCVYELSVRFARDGHDVTVATSSRGKETRFHTERSGELKIIRFPERFHLFEAPIMPNLASIALTADYDILHIHGMSPSITDLSILFAKLRRKPVVLTYHNDAESDLWGGVTKAAAFVYSSLVSSIVRMSNVVVSSTRSYADTSPALRYSMNKLRVIPMGVDTQKYDNIQLRNEIRPERNLLFVGQLKDYKGVEVLLESLSHLRNAGHEINTDIVGTGPNWRKLVGKAKQLHIDTNVRFRGNVSDDELLQLYANCDSLVLPSVNRREAFGIVLLEAKAAGKNVVASDIPGVNEVASIGGGYLAKPNDPISLARSILNSLESGHHPDKIRQAARALNWDTLAAEYESVFESLTNGE